MPDPHCLIGRVSLKQMVLPRAFKTLTSCHKHNPYGEVSDYYVRRDGVETDFEDELMGLTHFVRATR
ncbi:hypothetical protein SAMN02927900_04784 [Rhizobium mongolense subsp. loessense]|uniref:Uncharacterized protein n=1 Tax=Rhizobium mongolense subsp. loessense TaxID=158890 RepID=A0A1G4T712_9HYPH|nr:hypothetical protein [Rhizobium mongolense]SCW77213.1 hypothetical protein SAMN02927900_04784 [Rhizobium mongolense subsp. loessense]